MKMLSQILKKTTLWLGAFEGKKTPPPPITRITRKNPAPFCNALATACCARCTPPRVAPASKARRRSLRGTVKHDLHSSFLLFPTCCSSCFRHLGQGASDAAWATTAADHGHPVLVPWGSDHMAHIQSTCQEVGSSAVGNLVRSFGWEETKVIQLFWLIWGGKQHLLSEVGVFSLSFFFCWGKWFWQVFSHAATSYFN